MYTGGGRWPRMWDIGEPGGVRGQNGWARWRTGGTRRVGRFIGEVVERWCVGMANQAARTGWEGLVWRSGEPQRARRARV